MRNGLTKFGRPAKSCGPTPRMAAALEEYRTSTTLMVDICEKYGVSRRGLGLHVKRLGLNRNDWSRGYTIDAYGYALVYAPDHPWPRSTPQIAEHVRVMELHIGRRLAPGECVHHKDRNRLNNAIENLELTTLSEHSRYHRLHPTTATTPQGA